MDIEFIAKQRKLAAYQRRMRENPTAAELKVKQCLDKIGCKYVFQKGFLRDKTVRIVDFWFPHPVTTALEIDGKYHDFQRDYDIYREGRIMLQRSKGVKFVRMTNEFVLSLSEDELARQIVIRVFGGSDIRTSVRQAAFSALSRYTQQNV